MTETKSNALSRFGFSAERGGAHTARTMMFKELTTLLEYVVSTGSFQKRLSARDR